MIEAKDLVIHHPDGAPIGPLNATTNARITLVTGRSGSGKSTLLRAACGIIPNIVPARLDGRIRIHGHDPARLDAADRPRLLGWMPQELTTTQPTPWDEIAYPCEQAGLEPSQSRRRVQEWLARLELEHVAERSLHTLSGGETARVVLAAALAPEPRVLLLDEPMAQLGGRSRQRFLDTLAEHVPKTTYIVAATHKPDEWSLEHETLALTDTQPAHEGALLDAPTGPPLLTIHDARPAKRSVRPLSLSLAAGSQRALVGDNGSGKTSLLLMAAGLLSPETGHVRIQGVDPRTLERRRRAQAFGMAFQDPSLHVTQDTVWQEATLTRRLLGLDPKPVESWLARFHLDGLRDRHPWDLSGGERQRLAIVTALAHEPLVALLDEPTRGMDARHHDDLLAALSARAAKGQATLVATHDEDLARHLAPAITLEATT